MEELELLTEVWLDEETQTWGFEGEPEVYHL